MYGGRERNKGKKTQLCIQYDTPAVPLPIKFPQFKLINRETCMKRRRERNKRLYARNIYTCKSWKLKKHIYIHGYVVGTIVLKLGILSTIAINGFPIWKSQMKHFSMTFFKFHFDFSLREYLNISRNVGKYILIFWLISLNHDHIDWTTHRSWSFFGPIIMQFDFIPSKCL